MTSWLAATLASYGLPVERLPARAVPPRGSVLVQGQIVVLNEGNGAGRSMVGPGARESSLRAKVQLYDTVDPRHPWLLRSFSGTAASGTTHPGAEIRQTPDTALAEHLAQDLARQIGAFAVSKGWIAPDVLR